MSRHPPTATNSYPAVVVAACAPWMRWEDVMVARKSRADDVVAAAAAFPP